MALVHALAKLSIELTIYFHSFEIFIIQIGEMGFCKPEFIFFQVKLFSECSKRRMLCLDDFEALMREIDVRALV
jgi:hypothetical protein